MLPLAERTRQFGPDVYGNDLVTYRSTFTSMRPGVRSRRRRRIQPTSSWSPEW
jgi:hypothetical protein